MNNNTDIDLDINNYTVKDIEYFLGLDNIQRYTSSDIENAEYEIRQQLFNGGNFNSRFKRTFTEFITSAKKKLMDVAIQSTYPTTLPQNIRLDPVNYPKLDINSLVREPELIDHPETAYSYTQQSDFFPGQMNPLSTRILTKCLTIDTRFRDNTSSTSSSDFIVQLPLKLSKVVSMQMSSLEFPISFYGISETIGNNFLNITLLYLLQDKITSTRETRIYKIPDGNYNAIDLIDVLNRLLSLTGVPDPSNNFSYIKFSLDLTPGGSGTRKVSVGPILGAKQILELQLDFTKDMKGDLDIAVPLTSRFGYNLGFTKAAYVGGLTYISESVISPTNIKYVYLSVDDYNNNVNNHFITAFNKSILNPNILARIAITCDYFTTITEKDMNLITESRQYFGPVDIQRLHIRLFDDFGRILNMNQSNFSFCLTFKLLYNL